MTKTLKRLAEAPGFTNFITGVILFAGVLVGIETYPDLNTRFHGPLHLLDKVVLGIFVIEIVVKMGAEGSKPWNYFKDPWNIFDFVIVAAAFMSFDAQYVTVLRLLRLLRVLKLVRAIPKLQILVGALLKSLPSMAYVSLLLFMLFYVYAVAATFMFGENDPIHFKNLQLSLLSLFRAVTLEDWTDLMYIQMKGCAGYGYDGNMALCTQSSANPVLGALFFVSFILIGTMVMLNLFIGVIMNGMSEAQKEAEDEERARSGNNPSVRDELELLERELGDLVGRVAALKRRSAVEAGKDPGPALHLAAEDAGAA